MLERFFKEPHLWGFLLYGLLTPAGLLIVYGRAWGSFFLCFKKAIVK